VDLGLAMELCLHVLPHLVEDWPVFGTTEVHLHRVQQECWKGT
jgi:hypothetical protein